MKCLILGGSGQLGRALQAGAPQGIEIAAPRHRECDVTDKAQLERQFGQVRPVLVINASGFTDVNGAESNEAQAFAANAQGPGMLASLCREMNARLIHVSTDYVFDGAARAPYREDAPAHPLNVYGRSKLEGENLVRSEYPQSLILRTAWLYGAGGRNFVTTMLRLMGDRDQLRVVADQAGTPTHAANLARALWRMTEESGLYHFTDEGETSWYGFALAIRDEAVKLGLLTRSPEIMAIATADYPTSACRPAYSVLDNAKIRAKLGPGQPWRAALVGMLSGL